MFNKFVLIKLYDSVHNIIDNLIKLFSILLGSNIQFVLIRVKNKYLVLLCFVDIEFAITKTVYYNTFDYQTKTNRNYV